jgi:hypothetical protein
VKIELTYRCQVCGETDTEVADTGSEDSNRSLLLVLRSSIDPSAVRYHHHDINQDEGTYFYGVMVLISVK